MIVCQLMVLSSFTDRLNEISTFIYKLALKKYVVNSSYKLYKNKYCVLNVSFRNKKISTQTDNNGQYIVMLCRAPALQNYNQKQANVNQFTYKC